MQNVSYVFFYLSVGIFSILFNLVFITSYSLDVLFCLYVKVTMRRYGSRAILMITLAVKSY